METLHATAAAFEGRAVLLLGPPGAGKSDLALRLVGAGWRLVADDRVAVTPQGGRLMASAPPRLAGLMEVRGVGIVPESTAPAPIALALDLSRPPVRLPEIDHLTIAGHAIPLLGFDPFGESAPARAARALQVHGLPGHGLDGKEGTVNPPILIISGLSGAGKSTVLRALEDAGHEVVDNLPLSLFDALIAGASPRPLALGIDSRTRAFDAKALGARVAALRDSGRDVRLITLECSDDVLIRRFSETRRRHPLALDRPAIDGIRAEREMLGPLQRWADLVIDTTELSVTDLRARISERFGGGFSPGLTVTILSFGFSAGLPRDADLVFDMRFLTNPHWDVALRPLTGEDDRVAAHVAADPLYAPTLDKIDDLVTSLLPGYAREGKAYLTIAIGCTGGRHRSVAVARALAARLVDAGQNVALVHRDLARQAGDAGVGIVPPLTEPPKRRDGEPR